MLVAECIKEIVRASAAADGGQIVRQRGARTHPLAWLMSPGAWQALCAFDFTYTTTLGRLHLLREGRAIRALSLVYSARTPLRRWSSCAWNEALSIGLRDAPLVRVGLHPADVKHPALSVHIQRMVDRVRRGRIALTKGDYAARGRRL